MSIKTKISKLGKMEKLFYYSGLILWICITGLFTLYISGIIYDKFLRGSVVFHWFSVMLAWINFKKLISEPIYQDAKDAIEGRYKWLQENKTRKFEQKFLRKYLDNVKIKVKGPNWTVFDK